MSIENDNFKERVKHHPVRIKAISDFNKANQYSAKRNVRQYICQVMATIGLELETKFPDLVSFGDGQFKLFGREKSLNSTLTKKKLNIQDFEIQFESALQNNTELPKEVRPIFDFYAYKFVCPEIQNPRKVITTVVCDILNDISNNYSETSDKISQLTSSIDSSLFDAIDFIDNNYSDLYPDLKNKILSIMSEQETVNNVQSFLDNTSSDISSLTYSEYYSKVIAAYQLLIKLSYEESYEEYVQLASQAQQVRDDLSKLLESEEGNTVISKSDLDTLTCEFDKLLKHVSNKKTNKLDLALADLMFLDILATSKELKRLGVKCTTDPTRNKHKRNPNGYIADFFSLDLPNNLKAEIQLQPLYRYKYGETGPAAHHKMAGGHKKRILLPRPKKKSQYNEWAEAQFKSLPRFFAYRGKGYVEVYNTLKNFRRHFKCEDKSEVQTYIEFIASHDVDLLEGKLFTFSFGEPSHLSLEDDEQSER